MPVSPAFGEGLAEPVARIYEEAELRILRALMEALAAGVDDPWWERDALARLQGLREAVLRVLQQVNPDAAAAIQAALAEAYEAGGLSALREMGTAGPVAPAEAAAVAALAGASTERLADAMPMVLRAVDDAAREVMREVLERTVTGTVLRRDAIQQALNGLAQKGLRTVQVGKGQMGLADYSRMAVRTGTAQALVGGHLQTLRDNGVDLCTILPGPRPCETCDDWAGKVLSQSGRTGTIRTEGFGDGPAEVQVKVDATVAQATAAGWGHPNCRCRMAAYLPGVTKRRDVTDRPKWDEEGYRAQQDQRAIERRIRQAKSEEAVAMDAETQARARARVRQEQARMRQHIQRHPYLKRQSVREQVLAPM